MISKFKFLLIPLILILFSCDSKFIGFDDFKKRDVGNVKKIEVYFSEEDLARLYSSVSRPEQGYVSGCAVIDKGPNQRAWMKVRGYTSRGEHPKKNFSLRLEENGKTVDYALMHEAGTWFKNRVVMYAYNHYVYNGGSLTAAPETEAVALFINDEYAGYYSKVDIYSEKSLREFKDGDRCELFKVLISNFENKEPSYDRTEKKIPDDKDFSSLELLINNLNRMSDKEWNEWIVRYFDIDNFIRYVVIHNFFGLEDTDTHNYYLYNYGKMMYLPWDNEEGMRIDWDLFMGNSKLMCRILSVPSIKDAYMQAMRDFVADKAFLQELKDKVNQWYRDSYLAIKNDPIYYHDIDDATRIRDHILYFIDNRGTCPAYKKYFPD